MEDFNPRSPIRLSDIDNLLQESIFESSDGAKLVEYLKKKRGGGRVRLQNIFQQVPVQRAQFNFNLDSSEPTPLPASPQPTTSNGDKVTEVVVTNGEDGQEVASSGVVPNGSSDSPRVPIVIVNDLNTAKKSTVKQIVLKSPGPMNTLSRQLLINQYQRTNVAKCELLKQLASSTPKPDSNGSVGRMSTFTTSISPITEGGGSPLTPVEVIPSSQPVATIVAASPVHVMEIVVPPAASQEVLVPCSQPILAPCSQAVPTDATPKKVVVLKAAVDPDNVIIPETPSPVTVPTESPKAPPHHIEPRRLSVTFKQIENAEDVAYANGHITSDESEGEEGENAEDGGSNSVLLKSILKDTSMGGSRSRHSMRVSFSKQLVQQREISPAPDIPEANDYNDSSSSDDSDVSESDYEEENDYQVVDEVYTDDDGEDAANREHYEELKSRICELNNSHNGRRSVSPLIDVVKETPVQWFETTTPTKRRDQQAEEEQQFPPPTTAKKDNKTNLQLVDIITDWDDEEDDEEADQGAPNPEIEPSQESLPEPRVSTNSNNHETNLDTMDISSSNLEDSVERLVELPPDPNAVIEEEGILPEEHIYPAAVDEQMPSPVPQITTEELVEVLSGKERSETPSAVDLPTPPKTPGEEPQSPDRVITPPIQFTSSAKRRFIQQNEDDLISKLQNDLPPSQADSSSQIVEEPNRTYEKVSETLVEIAQSFRDQPAAPAPPAETTARKVVQPPKRGKKSSIDPVTASYFEAIEKTFAKPKAPPPTTQRKKTEQKRKLYDATLSEVTEDEESMRVGPVAKPAPQTVVSTASNGVEQITKLRNLKIVVEKVRVEEYLPIKKTVASRPKEPESKVAEEPVVEQKADQKAASKSLEKQPEKPKDLVKKPRGRPKKVRPEVIGEQAVSVPVPPVENGFVEDPTPEISKKKHKLKPNIAGDSRQQRSDESVPTGPLEHETRTDNAVEKKRSKPNHREEVQPQPPNGSLVKEHSIPKEKKKRSKPNLAADSQQQRSNESLPGETLTDAVELDIRKDKVVEKKRRSKTNQREELQQKPDDSLPAVNGESVTDGEQNGRKDKKKNKLKPNIAPIQKDVQPEQPLLTEPVQTEVQQSSKEVVAKKKKLRPNFGKKSKQQHAEVTPPPLDEERRLNEVSEAQPIPTVSLTEAGKPNEKQPKIVDLPASTTTPCKIKVVRMVMSPTVSLSPASKAIMEKEQQPVSRPSPALARKLFDEPGSQAADEVQVAKKLSHKIEKQQRMDADSRNKRKEAKRAKKASEPIPKASEPIPKVRISAEKDGIYRITTPGREVDSTLNVTGLDTSANVRSSLEDCPEEFLGFEEDDNTIQTRTVDFSRSNLELIIPLEPARIPKGVKITPVAKKDSRKSRRQSRSPATKRKEPRKPGRSKRMSGGTSDSVAKDASSLKKSTAGGSSQLDNSSLPLKKRKSRDSSQEYLPSAPEDDVVFAVPAPVPLNDSLLIPMLQRVPIADKYVVRSTPDRGTESTTEYDTDDTCATGDNVLIVRKETPQLNRSRLSPQGEEGKEDGTRKRNKKPVNRQSIIPKFYGDNTFDITWKPHNRSRKNKRRLDNDSGIEEEESGAVRRSKRTCRISKQILMTNPLIKSAYDRPNYRPMSVEQLLKAEKIARKLKQEENARQRKPVARNRKASKSPRRRKRAQEPVETQEDQQQAKRNRIDVEVLDVQPTTSSSGTAVVASTEVAVQIDSEVPAVPTTSSSSGTKAVTCTEVAIQVDEDRTLQQERQEAQSWMLKLMAENSGREEVMPQATSSGDRMHFTLDHLTFQERNGIQYSFFIYSETENFGFLRFAPAAVKKWTRTADFLLKFLVLNGQLSFKINDKETVTKGGDFLMLPQNTRYYIKNSDEISLVFMIKFRVPSNELPSMKSPGSTNGSSKVKL